MDDQIAKKTVKKLLLKGKDARLAAALRENLRKRKTQQRERVQAPAIQENATDNELPLTQEVPQVKVDALRCPSGQ